MKKTWLFRVVDIFLVAAIAAGLSVAVLSGFTPEEAAGVAWLVVLVSAVLSFLLTRVRWGCVVLFLIGTFLCAGAYFLQFPIPLWAFLLFEFAAVAAFLWRTWYALARQADAGTLGAGASAARVFVFCVLGFAVAAGIYYGAVRPLDPPTRELKLIRELKSMELLEVLGVARTEIVLDPELRSEAPPEEEGQGDESGEDESDAQDDRSETEPPPPEALSDGRDRTEQAAAVRYDLRGFQWLWLLLSIPVAVAAAYILRLRSKRRWRERVRALPGRDAVVNYYRYFLSRLSRAGYPKPPQQTLEEFSARNAAKLEPFARGEGGFERLTAIYEKALYGRGEAGAEEIRLFEETYDAFPAALRRELGPVRYYLTAFRY